MTNVLPGNLTATKLRIVLFAAVVAVVLLQVGLIFAGQHVISNYGKDVSSAVSIASSDEKTLHELENINTVLKTQRTTVEKSQKIIADKSNPYQYQNQIINDITAYANKAGITITGYAFEDNTTAAPNGAATPSQPAAATGTPAAQGPALPSGVTPLTVTIDLGVGASYESLYTFLALLEGNLLHMELQGLTLSRSTGQDGASGVAPSNLTIQVYKQS